MYGHTHHAVGSLLNATMTDSEEHDAGCDDGLVDLVYTLYLSTNSYPEGCSENKKGRYGTRKCKRFRVENGELQYKEFIKTGGSKVLQVYIMCNHCNVHTCCYFKQILYYRERYGCCISTLPRRKGKFLEVVTLTLLLATWVGKEHIQSTERKIHVDGDV